MDNRKPKYQQPLLQMGAIILPVSAKCFGDSQQYYFYPPLTFLLQIVTLSHNFSHPQVFLFPFVINLLVHPITFLLWCNHIPLTSLQTPSELLQPLAWTPKPPDTLSYSAFPLDTTETTIITNTNIFLDKA